MSFANEQNPYEANQWSSYTVAQSPTDVRSEFIRKTYLHVGLAVCAFIAIEAIIFALVPAEVMLTKVVGPLYSNPWMGLVILGAFMLVSFVANKWALSSVSKPMQYAGLFLYVIAEALIFVPILAVSMLPQFAAQNILPAAALITGLIFGGLTAIVFITKADFSFLRMGLTIFGFAAIGLILCSIFFGLTLGIWFTVLMVVFAAGYILYDTSNIMHHYRPEQYVAAALGLFASVAMLFFYVLKLLIQLQGRD